MLLLDFHKIIQTIMGWTNSHLNDFVCNGDCYSTKNEHVEDYNDTFFIDYQKKKNENIKFAEKRKE